jgi:hypothetical protein
MDFGLANTRLTRPAHLTIFRLGRTSIGLLEDDRSHLQDVGSIVLEETYVSPVTFFLQERIYSGSVRRFPLEGVKWLADKGLGVGEVEKEFS